MASKSKFFFSKNSLFYILVEYQLRLVKMIFMSDSIDFVSILVSKIFVYGKFIYSSKCNGSEIIYVFSKDFLIKSIFKTSSTKSDNIAFCKPEKSSDKRNMFEHVKLIQFDMSKASNDANPNSSRSRQVRLVCLLNSIIIQSLGSNRPQFITIKNDLTPLSNKSKVILYLWLNRLLVVLNYRD